MNNLPQTLAELRRSHQFSEERVGNRRVKDEMRENLVARLRGSGPIFPASSATTTPWSPRSSTRFCRGITSFCWDCGGRRRAAFCAHLPPCSIRNCRTCAAARFTTIPYDPICRRCRELLATNPDEAPIAYLTPEQRYVEKLATPDVTIADLIGDIDPIKAAKGGSRPGQRIHGSLRTTAPRQSRHLRHQRTA